MAPLRIVVMGVAGSGKTTVGERLAGRFHARFVDADAVHPPANVAKMSAGIPLTDADRAPWLERLAHELADSARVVVTCSALKRDYRDVLRSAGDVTFVFLDVDRDVAVARAAGRADHFMKADMVDSQFATLEAPPGPGEHDVVAVDADRSVDEIIEDVVAALEG